MAVIRRFQAGFCKPEANRLRRCGKPSRSCRFDGFSSEPNVPIVEVDRLSRRFDRVTAVDGIDFTVEAGKTVALLGGNGAGKTTTISMLLGLLKPTSGGIKLFGLDIAQYRHRVLRRMNFSSPYVDLPHRLTPRQNLTIFGLLYGLRDVRARIAELAGELDLTALMDRRTGGLSAGQKTRVALAKALLNRPE